MTDTPLRELLTDLTRDPAARAHFEADPAGWLASQGHDLPDDLVAEAITSVSAVLPVDVAEHLSPFTIAASPIPSIDGDDTAPDGVDGVEGLELLTSAAPTADGLVEPARDGTDIGDVDQFGAGATDPGTPTLGDDVGQELGTDIDPLDGLDASPSDGIGDTEVIVDAIDALATTEADFGLGVDPPADGELGDLGDDPADLDGLD